jgi:hypothetical protein
LHTSANSPSPDRLAGGLALVVGAVSWAWAHGFHAHYPRTVARFGEEVSRRIPKTEAFFLGAVSESPLSAVTLGNRLGLSRRDGMHPRQDLRRFFSRGYFSWTQTGSKERNRAVSWENGPCRTCQDLQSSSRPGRVFEGSTEEMLPLRNSAESQAEEAERKI